MNKAKIKEVAGIGAKVGKRVVVAGTQAITISALGIGVNTLFSKGISGLRELTYEELLGIEDEKSEEDIIDELEEA